MQARKEIIYVAEPRAAAIAWLLGPPNNHRKWTLQSFSVGYTHRLVGNYIDPASTHLVLSRMLEM